VDSNHSRELRVVFAGGGTGGHLYPALALAEAFEKRDREFSCVFIGTRSGIESRVLPALGRRLHVVWMRGLLRKLSPANLLFPLRLLVAAWQSWQLIRRFRPHVIIGTGGYVSAPALVAARWSGVPHVLQEQNSFPGLTTRWLSGKADAVFLTFSESRKFFKPSTKVRVVGNPVRGSLQQVSREEAVRTWSLRSDALTLLVFGGSQGARRINQITLEVLPSLVHWPSLQVLWAAGPANFAALESTAKASRSIRLVPYIENMALAYAAADVAVCRAGASTLAELALCGVPSILIPFPFATANHQAFNAVAVQAAGAAMMIEEKQLTAEKLLAALREIVESPERRRQMAAAARALAKPRAADDIVDFCISLAERQA